MNAYGDQQYGPPPGYGRPPGYGPPPGYGTPYGAPYPPPWPMVAAAWPYGPGRPGLATAAGVLGFVTAGLTIVVSLGFLAAVLSGDDADAWAWLMLLGLPCAAALIAGAAELLRRRPAGILFGSAMASIVVLVAVLVVGALELPAEEFPTLVLFLGCALPLPVLTAVFARAGRVTGWVAAGGSPVA